MKKLIIIFIAIFMLVGCSNANFMEEQEKITEDDLIGLWDEVLMLKDGTFYSSGIIFYENNKCSMFIYVNEHTIADTVHKYKIDGYDIYIDGTLAYIYDEENNTLVQADDYTGVYHKRNNNPCDSAWSHCD